MSAHGWINTASGVQFWPLSPRIDDIHPSDIGHALSRLCRYGGHTSVFYSVAEHSVRLAAHVMRHEGAGRMALAALLHDGSEAYLVDVPRPLKGMPSFAPYRAAEAHLQEMIYRRFGVAMTAAERVTLGSMDAGIIADEAMALMPRRHREWDLPVPLGIEDASWGWEPDHARSQWMAALIGLWSGVAT